MIARAKGAARIYILFRASCAYNADISRRARHMMIGQVGVLEECFLMRRYYFSGIITLLAVSTRRRPRRLSAALLSSRAHHADDFEAASRLVAASSVITTVILPHASGVSSSRICHRRAISTISCRFHTSRRMLQGSSRSLSPTR